MAQKLSTVLNITLNTLLLYVSVLQFIYLIKVIIIGDTRIDPYRASPLLSWCIETVVSHAINVSYYYTAVSFFYTFNVWAVMIFVMALQGFLVVISLLPSIAKKLSRKLKKKNSTKKKAGWLGWKRSLLINVLFITSTLIIRDTSQPSFFKAIVNGVWESESRVIPVVLYELGVIFALLVLIGFCKSLGIFALFSRKKPIVDEEAAIPSDDKDATTTADEEKKPEEKILLVDVDEVQSGELKEDVLV
jgi:hypothetical protein